MIRIILAGGYLHKAPDEGKYFCEELIRGKSRTVRILICMFARLREVWDETYARDIEFFHTFLPEVTMAFELAEYENFIDQVGRADIIYLRGGSSEELVRALEEKAEWKKYLEGKTIAGSSAGADALSTFYFGLHDSKIRKGVGLALVKVIPHFKSDYHGWEFNWDGALQELKDFGDELPVFALGEGEFKVVEIA